MSYKTTNHIEVKNDVFVIKKWYKKQQKGLEKRFVNEVKNVLNYIIANPLLFEAKYKNVRTAYTKVFPYGVHFYVDENTKTITILGIFHTSISPKKWLKRL